MGKKRERKSSSGPLRVKERKGDAQDEAGFGIFNPARDPGPGLKADVAGDSQRFVRTLSR